MVGGFLGVGHGGYIGVTKFCAGQVRPMALVPSKANAPH